jgi:ribonuclease HI
MIDANSLLQSVVSNHENHEHTTHKVSIFAEGSCLRNPREPVQSGAGIVIILNDTQSIKLKAAYLGALTNQEAEILAFAIALESLNVPSKVKMFSNSKYVIDAMIGKNPIKENRATWERLVKACFTHKIDWIFVHGQSGNNFQEISDLLSRAAATAKGNLNKTTLDRMALMLCGKPDRNTVELIHRGLKMLAADCDGAELFDGKGFSKFDSEIGKRYAAKADLTVSDALFARKILSKYRSQILKFDTELALLV